jgi:hypothetical protein
MWSSFLLSVSAPTVAGTAARVNTAISPDG